MERRVDIVASVDSMVIQISAAYLNQFLREPYTELFKKIKKDNTYTSLFVYEDATANIEPLSLCIKLNQIIFQNIAIYYNKIRMRCLSTKLSHSTLDYKSLENYEKERKLSKLCF